MQDTRPLLLESDFPPLHRASLETVQVNLGYLCNLSCVHCHVNAGPTRTELMQRETIEDVLALLRVSGASTLDLTGGAPELNPHFRYLVTAARALGVRVIDRCNLTVLFEPGQEDLAQFLADNDVEITASLPCYSKENVEAQRGKGVFDPSIEALRLLNSLGYGDSGDSGETTNNGFGSGSKKLNLVYNPGGPSLPPPQQALEADYKRELNDHFGIRFDALFTITNMPISRFGATLLAQGQYTQYMQLLRDSFSESNLDTVMCRSLVSIDWQGYVYDCDFNQMLALPVIASDGAGRTHIRALVEQPDLADRPVFTGEHCWGCTAGQGSSCGGALDEE